MNMVTNKKGNLIKMQRKEVAQLLDKEKDESARIKGEGLIHEQNLVLCMETLILMCDLLAARIGLLDSEKECPEDLVEACASIIYCAGRVEVSELKEIGQFLGAKFGKQWAESFINNDTGVVSQRVIDRLSVKPPPFEDVIKLLTDIAEQFDIDWKPNLKDDRKENHEALGAIAPIEHTEEELKGDFTGDTKIAYPGTLNVIVHKAQKLYDTQLIGKEKPYVKIRVLNDKNWLTTTVDAAGGRAPKWDQEHFPFSVKSAGQRLQVEVWNSNTLGDDHIGNCLLNIDRLIFTPDPTWYRLSREQGKTKAGAIMLSTQYLPLNMASPKGGLVGLASPGGHAGHNHAYDETLEGSSPGAVAVPASAYPPSYTAMQPSPSYNAPSGGGGGGGGMGMGVPAFGGGFISPSQPSAIADMDFPMPRSAGGAKGGAAPASPTKHEEGDDNPPEFDELEARFNALKKN